MPQEGFQEAFVSSSADVIWGGGNLGGGKSIALTLAMYPLMIDPDFRCLISRRAIQSLKAGGGFVEKFKQMYGEYCTIKESDNPRISFPNGAFCDLTYIDDSDMVKLRERAKGWEYDAIGVDEMTEMSFECFMYIMTRNRGNSKTFTGKMYATLNPKRSHWARKWLDWYIGRDGYIIPERDGKVRYFYINGSTVDDVVWGNSKEEVYRKCQVDIDRKLSAVGGDYSYEHLIKSFVFYQGKLSGNKLLLDNNANYLGSVAASGGKTAQALLEGNWNVDPEEEEDIPISGQKAREVFTNDPKVNADKWVTVDLADFGKNNLVALAWNGFHVVDKMVLMKTTPRDNALNVQIFAQNNGVAESHIIYDGTSARYFGDYVPDAICYLSSRKSFGMYANQAPTVKDMCYLRLTKMIMAGGITFDEKMANQNYIRQDLKHAVSFEVEFLEECSVVRFKELPNGGRKLLSKKEMNAKLGKDRSMDLLDPCAMRMYPCANIPYGEELEQGFRDVEEEETENSGEFATADSMNVYDDRNWY
ncbi:MAG: terminase large subunit domain-containing protein [Agathobacter sp.]